MSESVMNCSCLTDARDEAYVAIPRAKLEALMAAANLLAEYVADGHCPGCKGECTEGAVEPLCVLTEAEYALAALRAADIDLEDKT